MEGNHPLVPQELTLAEAAEEFPLTGRLYPDSGRALLRYGDDFYCIESDARAFGEVVHKLTMKEIGRIHIFNMHGERYIELSPAEIGEPPFGELQQRLISKMENKAILENAMDLVDYVLDPAADSDNGLRYLAAVEFEEHLEQYAEVRPHVLQKMSLFLPPEGYVFDMEAIFGGYDLCKEQLESRGDTEGARALRGPCNSFADTFPLLSNLLTEVQVHWEKNIRNPSNKRTTQAEIQAYHDKNAKMSSSIYESDAKRYQHLILAFLQNVEDCRKEPDAYFERKKMEETKGTVLWMNRKLTEMNRRIVEAGKRHSDVLVRYDAAVRITQETERLIQALELRIGTINETRYT